MTCYSYNGTQYPIGAKWDEPALAQRFECVMNDGDESPHADAIGKNNISGCAVFCL